MSAPAAATAAEAQIAASHPRASTFVSANAGSGKTSTLVKRVARLLLDGARPEAILCVTYTKAGAAEMQRRLFQQLGAWAVMPDPALTAALAALDEPGRRLSDARALFARALETPGGLKIQTIHAFCEQLLRRFPLEAGVSPGFTVLEDAAAVQVSTSARDDMAAFALAEPLSDLAQAYGHFSVQLDWRRFNEMFATLEARRDAIGAYVRACADSGVSLAADVWRRCGFAQPTTWAALNAAAAARIRWGPWRRAVQALAGGGPEDQALSAAMAAVEPGADFAAVWAAFSTQQGKPRARLGTQRIDPAIRGWLKEEQARHAESLEQLKAARVAEDTTWVLTLGLAYKAIYEETKAQRRALDFGDLVVQALRLLTERADAAWVLYKLDGGLEHVLLDEAQDTAPAQWDILRALVVEFFSGAGAAPQGRTVFAVGDEKQSIFSFQGAAPERLGVEAHAFGELASGAGARFQQVPLVENWRSAPEILEFVDAVVASPEVLAGLRPTEPGRVLGAPIKHTARRARGGCVELWPKVQGEAADEVDAWAPVDSEGPRSANKRLAGQIARAVRAMAAAGDGVMDRETDLRRPCRWGDVLILVRRRNALFHEIIRALKREGVPVSGADRLKLSEHGVFEDMMALGRFARFVEDDLTLAALLRSPFCDLDEESLFDLAHGRGGSLWAALGRRAAERPEWRSAAALLGWARDEAVRRAPFDFYCRALGRLDGEGRSMRQRILTRLGAEAEAALDAFLAQALAAETRGVRDLETFLAQMAATDLEIKREQDEADPRGGGEVRVMTAHGAKGLEAPIVILPDTTTRATPQAGPLLETADHAFLWAPRGDDDCPASAEARQARQVATAHESARLLYVALTRARDRLIICGVETRPSAFESSWYHAAQRAFDGLPITPFALEGGGEGWRYGETPTPVPASDRRASQAPSSPAWTRTLAREDAATARYASPSSLADGARAAAASPLGEVGGLGRYRRGELIHRLLERLPDLPPAQWPEAARRLLAKERDLIEDQRAEMAEAALGVLRDERFAAVFGPGSRPEVAIAGAARTLPADLRISGRIDRLVVEADRVLVVDFKTNRPAPDRIEDADPDYILQMALYAALLSDIYPGRKIEAALVWTDGPKLTPAPPELLAAALRGLARRAP